MDNSKWNSSWKTSRKGILIVLKTTACLNKHYFYLSVNEHIYVKNVNLFIFCFKVVENDSAKFFTYQTAIRNDQSDDTNDTPGQ